ISGLDVQYPGLGPRMIDLDLTTQDGQTRVSRLMNSGRGLLLSFDDRPRSIEGWADRIDHVTAKTNEEVDAVLVRGLAMMVSRLNPPSPDGSAVGCNHTNQPIDALGRPRFVCDAGVPAVGSPSPSFSP